MHERFLRLALGLARRAQLQGNVPIGAVIVSQGKVVARGHNSILTKDDSTAHAELICIRKAGKRFLKGCQDPTLYTTLEPCPACFFLAARARIIRIVWALDDPYKGGMRIRGMYPEDFQDIDLKAEPSKELREESRRLLHAYYSSKGNKDAVDLFSA